MAEDLGALGRGLQSKGVTHLAMESTGVYWKPVFNLWEGQFALVVGNAERIKALRGRKTDVADAEGMADLRRHGLLPGRFIPSAQPRALRDLTRFRTSVGNARVRAGNRLQKDGGSRHPQVGQWRGRGDGGGCSRHPPRRAFSNRPRRVRS